jgi:3-dehydroquinate synthase
MSGLYCVLMSASDNAVTIEVAIPGSEYEVIIGADLLTRLADVLRVPDGAQQAVVVTSSPIHELYGQRVERALEVLGLETHVLQIPDGEVAKSLSTAAYCWRRFAELDVERKDVVVALGGGVVGDTAGFAAATFGRGINILQLPTTLVAQVDSAIGGKTGVNLPEGKNLVGAFHQPFAVVADSQTLLTLPKRQQRSGLGEVVKYGFIADPAILDALERDPSGAQQGRPELMTDVIRRCVAVKAQTVAGDERDTGPRAVLNYGHTVGHVIETLSQYEQYSHGEAVAIGMVFAARLGERLGISEAGLAARTVDVLQVLGLPTGGVNLDSDAVWEVMRRDKKARSGVRFILCERPGEPVIVGQPDRAVVDEVLASLAG